MALEAEYSVPVTYSDSDPSESLQLSFDIQSVVCPLVESIDVTAVSFEKEIGPTQSLLVDKIREHKSML